MDDGRGRRAMHGGRCVADDQRRLYDGGWILMNDEGGARCRTEDSKQVHATIHHVVAFQELQKVQRVVAHEKP